MTPGPDDVAPPMALAVGMRERLVDTPHGPARVTSAEPDGAPSGRLVLGHGAGGLRWTLDVLAVRDAAVLAGWAVDLVDQPWRVAGRRVGPRPAALDEAWLAVLATVPRPGMPPRLAPGSRSAAVPRLGIRPFVIGGRSAGARVACRTASVVGASAVVALSFPLHPPGRPDRSRAAELADPARHGIPVHLVQGSRDPSGTPAEVRGVLPPQSTLDTVDGTHTLERVVDAVAAAVQVRLAAVVST
ncbi:MAG: alpha/beta hydrolase family protein [Dermatophilaceae bacterium]